MSRLLLIEHDPGRAEGLRAVLELEGYRVQVAGSASHPLGITATERPDFVVLDLGPQDDDGRAVLRQLLSRLQAMLGHGAARGATGADDGAEGVPVSFGAPASPLDDEEIRARFALTDRQLAVARLLAEGYSNSEIAARLAISPFTARNHVEQILAKLKAPSRARAGAILRGVGK